jgi:hypothetical protein
MRSPTWPLLAAFFAVSGLAGCAGKAPDKDAEQGCTKDTDCKGSRLCVVGRCQDAPVKSAAPTATAAQAPTATQAAAAGAFRAVPESEWKPLVGPRLRKGAVVIHTVFEGPIGPSPASLFIVTKEADGFHATVWADGRGYRNGPLANNGAKPSKIPAVAFFDADGDGAMDALVMATYTPEGAASDVFDNVLLRWNGTTLVRMHALENGIGGLDSVAAVRGKLKK